MMRLAIVSYCIVISMLSGAMALSQTEKHNEIKMFAKSNAICKINKAIDLRGDTVRIPDGYTLKFTKGGVLLNGVVIGNNTQIIAPRKQTIFQDCRLLGFWNVSKVFPQWFGAKADGKTDCTPALRTIADFLHKTPYCRIIFRKGFYSLSGRIVFNTACKIDGCNATITTIEEFPDSYAFYFSVSKKGILELNDTITDVSINFKTYSKPIGFIGYNKLYMHDCTISTFSSTEQGWPNSKFWFGIDCAQLSDALFKDIHIEQPVCYKKNEFNNADGLHLMGQCHHIIVDHLYGHAGDDFIALNASETRKGNIYNVEIKNCVMGSKKRPTKNGVRIYAHNDDQITVRDIVINNCKIYPCNSPAIYISNDMSGLFDKKVPQVKIRNLKVSNCVLYASPYEYLNTMNPSVIRLAGVDADSVLLQNISGYANKDSLSSFVNVMDYCNLKNVEICNSKFEGEKAYKFIETVEDGHGVVFRDIQFNHKKLPN